MLHQTKKDITGKVHLILICAFVVVGFSSCEIFHHHSTATYNKSLKNAPFDVVIVPGLPYDSAKLNPLFKARIFWAKELYDKGIAKHIISPSTKGL